ncbi:MAG: hypothetical protein KTR32_37760 [Granulosicoccus sp.]|nr:hypothetical protein [Granulosicoccus sp.]
MAVLVQSACSSLSPEARESLQDLRGALPKPLRGDAVPLEEQPLPVLGGQWEDKNFPMLSLKLAQSANKVTINREGNRYEIQVVERINATLTGRSIKAKYINNSPNQIRPTSGSCSGSVSKDSQTIRMTCNYGGETFPLIFNKSG